MAKTFISLMNVFHRKFVLASCSSFLKIELNRDKENLFNFKCMQFSKENVVQVNMCSDLLIDEIPS